MSSSVSPVVDVAQPDVRTSGRLVRFALATLALGLAFLLWKQMALQDTVRDLQMRVDDELCLQRHRRMLKPGPPAHAGSGQAAHGQAGGGRGRGRPQWTAGPGSPLGGPGGGPAPLHPDFGADTICEEPPAELREQRMLRTMARWHAGVGQAMHPRPPSPGVQRDTAQMARVGAEEPPRFVELPPTAAAAPPAAAIATVAGALDDEDEEPPPLEEDQSRGESPPLEA